MTDEQKDGEQTEKSPEEVRLSAIVLADMDVMRAERELVQVELEKKTAVSGAKDALEAARTRLHESIVGQNQPSLFGDPPGPDDWREVLVREGLKICRPSILSSLSEAGIVTMGDLADYKADKRLIDIKGLGEAKVTQIDDAVVAFHVALVTAVESELPQVSLSLIGVEDK